MMEGDALEFSCVTTFYGDRQLQFNVAAYILVSMLQGLELVASKWHTEQFATAQFEGAVRAVYAEIMLALRRLGVRKMPVEQ